MSKLIVLDAKRIESLLEAQVDNGYSIKKELKEMNSTLKSIDDRQKKESKMSMALTISLTLLTIYASAQLEIIDKDRLQELLNVGFNWVASL